MRDGFKFGRNPDIDSGPEDVWENGDDYTGQPDSFTPETVDVFSSSADDAAAGTGARTIRIYGLKSSTSTEYETEDITLNGVTAVTSTNTWWRVNNAGTITVRSTTTTANVFSVMAAGYNQSQIAAYTVPAGHSILLKRFRIGITRANGSAGSCTATLRARESGGVYRSVKAFDIQTGAGNAKENLE